MISILMPIYNGIEFIDESVSSIMQQTYTEWELIIGVNGHPPNSEVFQKAVKYANEKIHVYDLHGLKGKSNSLNKMLEFCKYNWVSLLDVDDKWLPEKLERQVPFMMTYDVVGTNCQYFGDLNCCPQIPLGNISGLNFKQVNPVINSSCLIKKDLCYWDANHDGVEDYDLWLKLWSQKKTFYNVYDILVLHRIHKSSAFNAQGNNNKVGDVLKKY